MPTIKTLVINLNEPRWVGCRQYLEVRDEAEFRDEVGSEVRDSDLSNRTLVFDKIVGSLYLVGTCMYLYIESSSSNVSNLMQRCVEE